MKLLQLLATEPSNDIFATIRERMLSGFNPLFIYLTVIGLIGIICLIIWWIWKKPKNKTTLSKKQKDQKDE